MIRLHTDTLYLEKGFINRTKKVKFEEMDREQMLAELHRQQFVINCLTHNHTFAILTSGRVTNTIIIQDGRILPNVTEAILFASVRSGVRATVREINQYGEERRRVIHDYQGEAALHE